MKNITILVATHKDFNDSKLPAGGYKIISVGAMKNSNWASDDDGKDNISADNPWYCELTAQYWAWKNLNKDVEAVGLVHYRRYFMDYKKEACSFWDDVIQCEKIDKILINHKIILPFITSKEPNGSILYRNKPINLQNKHWQIIYQIIKIKYPDYKESFEDVIFGKKQVWCNMFIATRDIFDKYCEWLFGVLKEYDNYIQNILKEERLARVDGFLSELLILVFVKKNINKKECYYLDVKNVETCTKKIYQKTLFSTITRTLRSSYLLLYVYKWIHCKLKVIHRCLFMGM